jgi:hypothetical protein
MGHINIDTLMRVFSKRRPNQSASAPLLALFREVASTADG